MHSLGVWGGKKKKAKKEEGAKLGENTGVTCGV